jgi:hypothetical protein
MTAPNPPAPASDLTKLVETLREEQDWRAAMIAGTTTAIICAAAWAALTYLTNTQFGIVAIAVGAVVGVSVRYSGKGVETKFGVLGAALAIVEGYRFSFRTIAVAEAAAPQGTSG